MLNEYSKQKNITLDSKDIQNAVMKRVNVFPKHMQRDILNWYYKNNENLNTVNGSALEYKVVKVILDNEVKATEKEYSCKELDELLDKSSKF